MKGFRDSLTISVAEQIHGKTTDLLQLIDDTGTKMVAESEGKPGLPEFNPRQIIKGESGSEIQYNLLTNPFNTEAVKDFLLPGCSYRQKIDAALTNYINYLSGLKSGGEIKLFKGLIDASIYLPGENPKNSEISLMTGLHSLILLKSSLLTVELYALTSIARQ